MIISRQRIRLAIDTSQMGTLNDQLTGATPQFWNGVDLQFELGIFYGATLASIANIDSITIDVKAGDPRTGLPLMSATLASNQLNQTLALADWQGGAATDCHALVQFTNAQTNLNLNADTETFWLVISALTNDTPAHKLVLGATAINVMEGGEGVEPPATVASPVYFSAAQSDARYARTVDFTTINTHLGTLDSEMSAVTTTANVALPQSGGTVVSLTIAGLSGVLKAAAGVVAGSATTSDLPEGSGLYWTQARFNAAMGGLLGVGNGICPLDSSSLIPASYLPSITVHNTFVVANQAAMLALAAHQGDVAIRTDLNESFILKNNAPTVLANWAQLLTPASAVTSVNGASGAVTLVTSNIAEGTNLYYTTVRAVAAALAATLTGFSNATGGSVTAGDTILTALGRLENRTALNDAKATGADRVLKAGDTMTGSLQFTGGANAGLVLSNLTDTQRAALTAAAGMLVYDTTTSQFMVYNGSWQPLAVGGGSTWLSGSGSPATTLGSNGAYYLDVATGNVWLLTAGTWAIIYAPALAALATTGGTMTGELHLAPGVYTDFGYGWFVKAASAGSFAISAASGGSSAFQCNYNSGTGHTDLAVANGNLNLAGSAAGLQITGTQVVGPQQAHIAHDTSGSATGTVLNNLLAALEAHGLIHS